MNQNLLKRLLALILCVILGATGCGSQDEQVITIWTQMTPGERAILNDIVTTIKQHPERYPELKGYDVRVRYYETEELRTNFILAALGGRGPELMYGPSDNVGPCSELSVIKALEEIEFEGEKAFPESFLTNFITEPITANTVYRGHLYQIADQVGNHLCLVYNKDIIETPPRSMDELIEWGKAYLESKQGAREQHYALVWNFIEPFFFVPFLGGYGGWIMNENYEPTLNTEATKKAATLIIDLRDKHRIIPPECDYQTAHALFKDGRAAMIINGPWSWAEYLQTGINFGIARIPLIDETGLYPSPMVAPKGYSINVNTEGDKLKATCALVKYLCSVEFELDMTRRAGTIPSRKEAFEPASLGKNIIPVFSDESLRDNEVLKGSLMQISVGKPMPVASEMRIMWDAMKPAYQAVLGGKMKADKIAAEMQSRAEKLITEMKQ